MSQPGRSNRAKGCVRALRAPESERVKEGRAVEVCQPGCRKAAKGCMRAWRAPESEWGKQGRMFKCVNLVIARPPKAACRLEGSREGGVKEGRAGEVCQS